MDGPVGGRRGSLRVILGAAPGVGKTYAMLGEGRRRAERGTDVVVGVVETHDRVHTAAMLEGLEVVPRRQLPHRGATYAEMDLDAVLARRPALVLVDELAHTNVPGSRHDKRWRDVEDLLAAGIDVITTVNVQHLESVNDVVEKITGVPQRETVPDAVVRAADQVELKDMTGEALRRRLAHGNVYAAEKVDAALGSYFRLGNLNALREIALLWTADRVDAALQHYRDVHRISGTWETRERVVVALTGGPEGETLVRRAARIATRAGGELLGVHVARSDGLVGTEPETVRRQQALLESLGGTFHRVLGDASRAGVATALIAFARAENATQLVLGDSRRSRLAALLTGEGIGAATIRQSGDIDVHIVSHSHSRAARLPHDRAALSRQRRAQGYALAVLLPALVTLALLPLRSDVNLVSDMLLLLLTTVVVALVGGVLPALVAAVAGSAALNWFFTPPLHTLTIGDANNALALAVFVVVALLVSSVVDLAARRSREAARAAAEAASLAELASAVLDEGDALGQVLERLRSTFDLESVTLLEGSPPVATASAGPSDREPLEDDEGATTRIPAGAGRVLVLRGRVLAGEDQRLVAVFAAQVSMVLDRLRLSREATEEAARADALARVDRTRTALLAAVGHDLRTPLSAAKASVSGLRARDVSLDEQDRAELAAAAEESLDRLAALVDDLLDMSRLQAGALGVHVVPVALEDVVALTLDALGPEARAVAADLPDDLPLVLADPGLLERVLENLLANAARHAPGEAAAVRASAHGERVEVRVVDRGPGIPPELREEVFAPFQRLGDTDNTAGVGLGLALARGLTEAMGGTLEPAETPGGGLTMTLALPAAPGPVQAAPGLRERSLA